MNAPTYQSVTEFYRDPASPYASFAQDHRSGGSMPVSMMRVRQDAFEATNPAIPALVISCPTKVANMPFRWNLGDGWTETRYNALGEMALFPPMTEVDLHCGGDHDLMVVALPSQPLMETLDSYRRIHLSAFDPLTAATLFRDEPIRRVMMQLWTESARAGGTSDLLIDGLTQVLIARLLDKAGALARPVRVPTLSQNEIARLDRVIADRLSERITVETLAQALDMPRWTFADAFKATTGETPHAYVTARRVERACDLLRLGNLPLAEVAYATGFASQSHMTDTFRRCLDTTPGAWRREVRT